MSITRSIGLRAALGALVLGLGSQVLQPNSAFAASPTISTQASAATTAGQTISDTATLTGGSSPTGTVTFHIYSDSNCNTLVGTVTGTVNSGTGVATSAAYTATTAGTYYFVANYPGDSNNAAVNGTCGDPNESVVVSQATPTISTQASAATTAGQTIHDTATLSGASLPTGTVTFDVYSDAGCTTLLTTLTGTVNSATGVATSNNYTAATAGTYYFVASYPGDANNTSATGTCGDTNESVVVSKANPTMTTQASATVVLGGNISDTATLSGASAPTGTVTFHVYADNGCTNFLTDLTGTVNSTTGVATSNTYMPANAGTYYFIATYPGDANNNGVTTACNAANESVVVSKATPSISTTASATTTAGSGINDTATVTGGSSPSGTVTFNAYTNSSCTGTPVNSVTNNLQAGTATSTAFTAVTAGTYYFTATYNGDSNNNSVSTSCGDANESVVVTKASPTIATTASAATTAGNTVHDVATLSGGSVPTGNVTFNLYANNTCTGTPVFTSTNAVSSASATSGNYTAPAGTYYWTASYAGDANNNAVASPCLAANESVVVSKATPSISTQASPTTSVAGNVYDTATVSGGYGPTGTVTFRVYNSNSCGTPIATLNGTLSGGVATSNNFNPTVAGTYYFVATYNGDANNNTVSGTCGDANESVVVSPMQPTSTLTFCGLVTSYTPGVSITIGGQTIPIAPGTVLPVTVNANTCYRFTVDVNHRITGGSVVSSNVSGLTYACGVYYLGNPGYITVSNAIIPIAPGSTFTHHIVQGQIYCFLISGAGAYAVLTNVPTSIVPVHAPSAYGRHGVNRHLPFTAD